VRYLGENSTDAHKYLVHDNGPGLAPGTEESVFEPFFKGMSTDGTGIGLSIVERIIHAYNGEINACNNNGACFEFTLRDA
jgi:C4-dicarboxylate-specific signal transduction histidine kinase